MLRKFFALLAVSFLLHGCGSEGGESESGVDSSMYKKTIDVFGVQVKGTAAVPDDKLLYAAKIMAEDLDQDNNGVADNPKVARVYMSVKPLLALVPGATLHLKRLSILSPNQVMRMLIQACLEIGKEH